MSIVGSLASSDAWAAEPTVICDMGRCTPGALLSTAETKGKWRLLPYEADGLAGRMISAASYITAPEIRLPLKVSGWYSVYVGYWNPYYVYDGGVVVKVKLSSDKAFTRFKDPTSVFDPNAEYLQEAFFKHADLTGEDLIIGKVNGPLAQSCHVAYVKLVPLTQTQVEQIRADRARRETRSLVATIDGMSYYFANEYRTREQLYELVERYRYSDVGKVILAVGGGDTLWYSGSKYGRQYSGDDSRTRLVDAAKSMPSQYVWSEKVMRDSLHDLAAKGIDVQNTIAEHVHSMDLKFDIMFRLGLSGYLPPLRSDRSFVAQHPEFRQVMRDGTVVEKASFAFPEVRERTLALIREATERFDVDGVNLCFIRKPPFALYEKPVLDAFRAKYGEDARAVDPADPRLLAVQGSYVTDLLRQARRLIDELGKKKGRRLEFSAWAWPGWNVKAWIAEGLLDSVIGMDDNDKVGMDQEYIRLGKEHNCRLISDLAAHSPTPQYAFAMHEAGVEGYAYWDMDNVQDLPDAWAWLSRLGHADEVAKLKDRKPTRIRLRTIGGYDCMQGLEPAVYSGG
jgi:hypothetical protein